MQRPRFRYDLRAELIPGKGIALFSERGHFLMLGEVYELLAPLLDGHRTEDQIIDRLRTKAPLAELYFALTRLEQKGFLVESNSRNGTVSFWDSLGISDPSARAKLKKAEVRAIFLDRLQKQQMTLALHSLGIKTSKYGFLILITDDYLRPEIEKWNRKMLQQKSAWMLMKLIGHVIWLGPIFRPEKTGCWQCLAHRMDLNRPLDSFVRKRKSSGPVIVPKPFLSSITGMAANLAATEIARWIVEENNERLEGKILMFDVHDFSFEYHTLIKRKNCKGCRSSKRIKQNSPASFQLEKSPKNHQDSGYRIIPAEETIQKYEHHISPITGVLSHLVPATRPESPLKVYTAGYNRATRGRAFHLLRNCMRSNSGGKGKTDASAKAGAMCEAIERYSGQFMGDEIRIRATYKEIGEDAIHPNDLMLFSEKQYRNRNQENKEWRMNFIPLPFDPDRSLDWTPVWSLTKDKFKYVPTAYCYYGYWKNLRGAHSVADSNGNAAGNTREEAIVQGFSELVERDSVAIWWYNALRKPGVNLDTFADPYFRQVKNYFDRLNRDLWVLDLTTDVNIPSFAAITKKRTGAEAITLGYGAHFHFQLALLRAVTEAGQLLPSDPETDREPWEDPDLLEWWQHATVENHSYLLPDPAQNFRTFRDYEDCQTQDYRDDVIRCIEIAKANGLEVLALDQTREDIGMPVVKVMVPGMRHFWARFAPGRLYDIPVRMGALPVPKLESDLNSVHLFL